MMGSSGGAERLLGPLFSAGSRFDWIEIVGIV